MKAFPVLKGGCILALILIVDDDPGIRLILRDALEPAGHAVLEASDGFECLQMVAANRPDLVFLDVFMPKMDGIETVMALRSRWSDLGIVGMSCGESMTYLDVLQSLGADRIMVKSISPAHVLALVDGLLRDKKDLPG